jgi:hypothetical protein
MPQSQDPATDLRVATFLDVRDDGELLELLQLWGAETFARVIAAVWFRREFVEWRAVVLRLRETTPFPGEEA